MNDQLIIGIDGGGSKTRGVLYRGSVALAECVGGTTRVGTVGFTEASERVLLIIDELCRKSNVERTEIEAIVVGLAGLWLDEEKQRTAHLIRTLSKDTGLNLSNLYVTSDAHLALQGALGVDPGIVLIGGTGSIAIGRSSDNTIYRCGGWGIELDDEGSGAWIGREGLTAIVRSIDGRGKKTALLDRLLQTYPAVNLERPRTIVSAYNERLFEYQSFTIPVMECADQGDEVCLDIIDRSAMHLCESIFALVKQIDVQPVKVALLGGMLQNSSVLLKKTLLILHASDLVHVVEPIGNALNGAALIAQHILDTLDD